MNKKPHIKIMENGPYIVTGNVSLEEKIIIENEKGNFYEQGQKYPALQAVESYALCRCGHSKNMPFCDNSHASQFFNGKETASKKSYLSLANQFEGPDLLLTDQENLCAFARFCHSEHGNVWELTRNSDEPILREEAVNDARNCPAGRLIAWDKETIEPNEPVFEPSIVIIQDPGRNCSGPLWVRGGIPIESSDGTIYEVRNRVTLCRCGESKNKPFCDASHVSIEFSDK